MAIPDSTPAIPEPLSSQEQNRIKLAADPWTDDYAFKIVKSDWAFAESYRVNAHDWRYRNADELYLAWCGQNFWEGTRVPRSSLGVYVVFGQVEAMLPKIVSAVTSTDQYHFSADQPGGEETELAALAWREMVLKQLGESKWREHCRRALKSMLIYGNGVIEAGIEDYEEEFINFKHSLRATKIGIINHPLQGPVPFPQETAESFSRQIKKEKRTRPYVRYVSVKDFYMDPNCESTNPQDAGYVMKRVYMRAEQLKALKDSKDFKIPDDEYLTNLSKAKATANQDVTKLGGEMFRYNMWNPSQDYTSDPSQKRIPVIEYTKGNRKIWWLQGGQGSESVIYNQPNRYGQINYFSCQYADVLDRWNALSISDVAEGDQRLQQALINARVDEVALAIHPPTYKRRGVTIPWYQLKRAPGRVTEVENPENDVKQAEIMNITQSAFVEVSASENRVQKMTGITDLAALGTPSGGGNSANRTATGVNTQSGATQDRMKYSVENIEDNLIEPLVNFIIKCDRKFMDPKQASNWLKLDPRFSKLDPEKVMNTKVSAECRASTKMAGRASFLQTFPMLMQTFLNPEYLQLVSQVNKMTLDPGAVEDTLWDSINYAPRKDWFVPMTQDQIKAQQQPPAAEMMKAQLAQAQMDNDKLINSNNLKTKLLDTLLKKGFDLHAKHGELDDKFLLGLIEEQGNSEQRKLDARGAGSDSSEGE